MKNMKLISVTFLLCALAILQLPTLSSSLQLKSPTQGSNEKSVVKMAPRKLLIISSEHANVAASTVHDQGSSEQLQVTSSGKSKDEEENALSKYLSMDYPKFRRRRPVHNKSLPLRP